jgi:hypothetical protein
MDKAFTLAVGGQQATLADGVWTSSDPALADILNATCNPALVAQELAYTPDAMASAFGKAVMLVDAEVVQAPPPGPPEDTT